MSLTEFKLKYAGSALGYVWSLVKPLLLFAILYAVFTYVFKLGKGVPNYPVYLLLGIVMWTFFAEATMGGMHSIVTRGDLIKKVNFPKVIIVVAAIITSFLTFLLNLIVVFIFLIFSRVIPTVSIILFIPVALEMVIFILGVSLILATLFTKFRDFAHIWEVSLQVLFYATPIIYPVTIIPHQVNKLVMLNPLAQIFQDSRWAIINNNIATSWSVLGLPLGLLTFVIVAVVLVVGLVFFAISSKNFAEQI